MIQSFPHVYKSRKLISNFYFLKKCFLKKFLLLHMLPTEQWKLCIIQQLFNNVVKSYGNCWALLLGQHVVWKFQRKKLKCPFVVSLPNTAMLTKKNALWSFRELTPKKPSLFWTSKSLLKTKQKAQVLTRLINF